MPRFAILSVVLCVPLGCGKSSGPVAGPPAAGSPDAGKNLLEARKGFQTKLVPRGGKRTPPDNPPPQVFQLVKYDAAPGKLSAYLTPNAGGSPKRPAIVWITGGDCNSIDDVWSPGEAGNDQTASQYRRAGMVMLFPSLRGGNNNPGAKEGFFGEVDDVLAAAKFLAGQPHVDPNRVYLGGHSTGGTLALLVAAAAPAGTFRGVFSFGPVHDVAGYGPQNDFCPFDMTNPRELQLRAPGRWLQTIRTPTFVFEGMQEGNIDALQTMKKNCTNPLVHFYPVKGATHFSLLAPVNRLIAGKVIADSGPTAALALTEDEVNRAAGGQ